LLQLIDGLFVFFSGQTTDWCLASKWLYIWYICSSLYYVYICNSVTIHYTPYRSFTTSHTSTTLFLYKFQHVHYTLFPSLYVSALYPSVSPCSVSLFSFSVSLLICFLGYDLNFEVFWNLELCLILIELRTL